MEASSSFAISYQQQISEQYRQQAEAVAVAMPPASSSAAGHKRKRNHPGTPNPDAEVIALSPKTLMATNRFICEVCNKGFQREQNLQLHRRGHNLPWKLKQKSNKDVVKKKVYLCPETTCIHHDPARALGDLTGIKKHYFRKHGEKKFKCDKCSKRYAVQSDWKAHSKNCGTREYRCDCGTLFSRRDSFITHRAFCDALAQETARHPPTLTPLHHHLYGGTATTPIGLALSQCKPSATTADSLHLGSCGTHLAGTSFDHLLPPPPPPPPPSSAFYLDPQQGTPISDPSAFNLSFFAVDIQNNDAVPSSDLFSTTMASSILNSAAHHPTTHHMSATALLQKATQMGSTSTTTGSTTFLRSSFTNNINDNIHNSNFHDLMNSLSACPMDSSGSVPASLFACDAFGDNNNNTNNNNYNHEISKYGSGYERGGKRLTRDFLGVGEIVRSMNGGGLSSKNTSQQLSGGGSGGALP